MAEGAPLLREYGVTLIEGSNPSLSATDRRGEMAERLKARAWKARVPERVPWVRIPLSPPTSPRLQRLCTRYPRPSQKLPRFRGVLEEGHSRIRTGDGEFRADSGQLVAFISVANFGGSDSLPIRPHREYWKFEFHSLRHPVCCCGDFPNASIDGPRKTRDSAVFWAIGCGASEPETASSGLK